MRFLSAYHAVGERSVVLTGTERMQQRPIKVLGKALKQIGAEIKYLKEKAFLPSK